MSITEETAEEVQDLPVHSREINLTGGSCNAAITTLMRSAPGAFTNVYGRERWTG